MPNKKSGFLSDHHADKDGLNFKVFQPALRNILENAETPLTVGIFGTWGSGKTTTLSMLKKDLEEKKLASLKTVWFTAWKYEQHDALWRAFILRVIDGLHPRKEDGTRYQAGDFNTKAEKNKLETLLHLERLERSIYETITWQDESHWRLDTGEMVKQGAKLPIWLAFHLANLGSIAKDIGLNPDIAALLDREVREHHMNQLSYMEQFASEFQKAVQMTLGKEGRLVVFVDDLDRCMPEKAIEVLEAIKLFLDVPGTVFVLGMDREIIKKGVEAHYGTLLRMDSESEIPINGDVYLQKLIQIPFNLPPLDMKGRVDFIHLLEKTLPNDYSLDGITRQVFGHGVYPNPRQVKRALNTFYLLKQVAVEQVKHGMLLENELAYPLLAKAVLIQSQWPELYKLWRQYPTLIQVLEEEYLRQPITEDEILRGKKIADNSIRDSSLDQQLVSSSRPTATGLIAPFINGKQKYSLLAEMLRYPDEIGEGTKRARFSGLKRTEVQIYVGLVGSFEHPSDSSSTDVIMLSEIWQNELESGDPVRIREVIASVNESELEQEGMRHTSLRNYLYSISCNPQFSPAIRANTADAADELGFLPDDLYDFVALKDSSMIQVYISRYPVTNIQYQRFLAAEDFANKEFWINFPKIDQSGQPTNMSTNEEGWNYLQEMLNESKNKVLYPSYWDDPRFGIARKTAPVVGISWWESNAYCRWLSSHWRELSEAKNFPVTVHSSNLNLRLPIESEWISASGGEDEKRFAFGLLSDIGNLPQKANTVESGIKRTSSVAMYPMGVSPTGVRDLSGNVWEWQANYRNLHEGLIGLRGGSWRNNFELAQVSARHSSRPAYRDDYIGFRIAIQLS